LARRYERRVARSSKLGGGPASRVIGLAMIHLAAAFLVTLLLYGDGSAPDRSAPGTERILHIAHDILWFPNDAILGVLPPGWLEDGALATVAVLVASSLVWGLALYGTWAGIRRAVSRRRGLPERGRDRIGNEASSG
jgi:hypothetical protein